MKAGSLVWVRDITDHPQINRPAVVIPMYSERGWVTVRIAGGSNWAVEKKYVRLIATADEIKQRHKERK